jgi:hypothetical protein
MASRRLAACYICRSEFDYADGIGGNDPWPLPDHTDRSNRCCDACDSDIVGPSRTRYFSSPSPTREELERQMQKLVQDRRRVEYHIGIMQREMVKVDRMNACTHPCWEDGLEQGIDEHRERICVDCGYTM